MVPILQSWRKGTGHASHDVIMFYFWKSSTNAKHAAQHLVAQHPGSLSYLAQTLSLSVSPSIEWVRERAPHSNPPRTHWSCRPCRKSCPCPRETRAAGGGYSFWPWSVVTDVNWKPNGLTGFEECSSPWWPCPGSHWPTRRICTNVVLMWQFPKNEIKSLFCSSRGLLGKSVSVVSYLLFRGILWGMTG